MQKWEDVEGNLASARGFRGAAVAAGIKKKRGELDLALLACDAPAATAAGLFTTNLVAAAPVILSRQSLTESRGRCRAAAFRGWAALLLLLVQGRAAGSQRRRRRLAAGGASARRRGREGDDAVRRRLRHLRCRHRCSRRLPSPATIDS